MNDYTEYLDDRINDLIDIYAQRAIDDTESSFSPKYNPQPTYDDTGDESTIDNMDEFYQAVGDRVIEYDDLDHSLRNILAREIGRRIADGRDDDIQSQLWNLYNNDRGEE